MVEENQETSQWRPYVRATIRVVLVLIGVGTLIGLLYALRDGVPNADSWGSILAAAIAAMSLLTSMAPQLNNPVTVQPVTVQDMVRIREDILRVREREADDRGLFKGQLLPVHPAGVDLGWNPAARGAHREQHPNAAGIILPPASSAAANTDLLWDHHEYSTVLARYVLERCTAPADGTAADPVRMLVHGTGGVGKTTLALMLTIGLAAWNTPTGTGPCQDDTTPVPLLLSLSGYTGRTTFSRWVNRKARRLYPALDRIHADPKDTHGRVGRLLRLRRAILILDGWDEMPSQAKQKAAAELYELVLSNWSIIILSRAKTTADVRARIGALNGEVEVVALDPPTLHERQVYLTHRANVGLGTGDKWSGEKVEQLATELPRLSELRDVLSTPMMLDLAARVIGLGDASIGELQTLAANGQKNATRSLLLQRLVAWATGRRRVPQQVLGHKLSKMWLTYLAHVMIEGNSYRHQNSFPQ